HFDRCPACRSAAVTADPTLLFRRLPELPLDAAAEQAEVAAMRQAVTAMRTARRLGPAGERRVLSHAWRWAAAAALAVLSLSLGTARDLRDLKGPQVASHLGAPAAKAEQPLLPAAVPAAVRLNSGEVPVVEELNRPAARVYQMNGGENLSVVMIVDERLDV
ncbi:MAG TPA: hypothetical protein VMM92_06575, partial [Thermoanaerobaculia bacterium]|nr:hypothetical protein [Thermoanaerobaculia bacterium]